MVVVNPYLTFFGNCEEAFKFYRSVFGGEFTYLGRFSEMPTQDGEILPEEEGNKIMHIALPLSRETVLMGSDTTGEWAARTKVGNNITLSITADNKDDADRFYAQLSEGGEQTMPMAQTFWGDYFGQCEDKFGINWMISLAMNDGDFSTGAE